MTYNVYLVSDAEEDLYDIHYYIATTDSVANAEKLLAKLEETCQSLSSIPNRGHLPPELEQINVFDYKEIHCKPYRIIYQILESTVYIHCILDGRRNIQQLLEKRLFRLDF